MSDADKIAAERDDLFWNRWARHALLALATGHLAAGVIFFFAYNWADLHPFAKFAILQGGMIVCTVAAVIVGIARPVGQALLIGATVFVGVLFAVIGQIYQTGADAYELFTAWTLLVLPWVLVSRSSAHWFLWSVIGVTAFWLFGAQVLVSLEYFDDDTLHILVGFMCIGFLVLRELAAGFGFEWIDSEWLRVAYLVAAFALFFQLALWEVFGSDDGARGLLAFATTTLMAGWFYYAVRPDFASVSVIVGFVTVLLMAVGGRLIWEALVDDSDGSFSFVSSLLLLLLWCGALTTMAFKSLRHVHQQMRGESA